MKPSVPSGADQQLEEVTRLEEGVHRIPRRILPNPRKSTPDQVAGRVQPVRQRRPAQAVDRFTSAPAVGRAFGVHPFEPRDPVPHAARPHRRGAGGVRGGHAAEGGPATTRRHGRKAEAMHPRGGIQRSRRHLRGHEGPAPGRVHVEPRRSERREVDDDPVAHVAPAHRAARAPRHQRRAGGGSPADQLLEVWNAGGDRHRRRHDPVDARALRVGGTGPVVGAKLAFQAGSLQHGTNVRRCPPAAKRIAGSPAILGSHVRDRPSAADPHRSRPPTRP